MANILVTGGDGFVGQHLIKRLILEGHFVTNMDYTTFSDIRNYNNCLDFCKNVSIIYHLAALKSVPESIQKPLNYNETNVEGIINLLDAAKQNKVKRFIFASSSSVYGNQSSPLPIKENSPLKPISPYAVTKLASEYYLYTYAELYNINTLALRFFNIYGPGQRVDDNYANVIPKFISTMLKGENPIIFGNGSQSRDYVYIDDVINSLVLAMSPNEYIGKFEAINIGSGKAKRVIDIVHTIDKILGKQIHPMYENERIGDVQMTLADINKAERQLGYMPQTSFREGLEKTIKYFQEKN